MGNGMATLARATVVADLYGPADYGTIAGVAALTTTGARAAGPFAAAVYAAAFGYGTLLWTLVALRRRRGARVPRRARGADPPAREAGMTASMIVVGAGQSGLAAAHAALRAGLRPVVLEASDRAAGAWPRYYDASPCSRRPATPRSPAGRSPATGALPDPRRGRPLPLGLRRRARRRHPPGHRVEHVEGAAAASSRAHERRGAEHGPPRRRHRRLRPPAPADPPRAVPRPRAPRARLPLARIVRGTAGPGRRRWEPGVQIAAELAAVARVSLATRSPLAWMPQRPLGRDLHWWLTRSGLDGAPLGRWLRGHATPVVDDGRYRDADASGATDRRPMFTAYTERGVRWPDGTDEPVDAIILATGYRPDLAYLAGTGALTPHGTPLHRGGLSTTVPSLGYVGLEYQRSIASATVRGVGRDARHVVGRLTPATQHTPRQRPARRIAPSCCRATP